MVEVAVHLPFSILPPNFKIIEIEFPDNLIIESVDLNSLEPNWNKFPYLKSTQLIGDQFISRNTNPILKVPSAVVSGDFNFLMNPKFIENSKIRILEIRDFKFDDRFFSSWLAN